MQNIKFRPRSDEEVTIRRDGIDLYQSNEKKNGDTDEAVHVGNVNGTPDKSGPNANVSMGNSPQEKQMQTDVFPPKDLPATRITPHRLAS